MRVEQLMKRSLRTCQREDSLDRAAQAMWESNSGCVPVVDAGGCLVGVVTDRDICMAAHFQGGPLYALKVHEAMSRSVLTCKPQDTVADAEAFMRSNRVYEVPIIDEANHVVGVLSLGDLASGEEGPARSEGPFNEISRTLDGVCRSPEDLISPV